MPLDTVVKLSKETDSLDGSVLADAVEALQEKVVSCVCMGDEFVVEDGEMADAGENEILEDGGGRSTARDDEHTR